MLVHLTVLSPTAPPALQPPHPPPPLAGRGAVATGGLAGARAGGTFPAVERVHLHVDVAGVGLGGGQPTGQAVDTWTPGGHVWLRPPVKGGGLWPPVEGGGLGAWNGRLAVLAPRDSSGARAVEGVLGRPHEGRSAESLQRK